MPSDGRCLYDYIAHRSTFNKRFEQFIEKSNQTLRQANKLRPDNNPLFTKKDNITKKQWVDYFLGDQMYKHRLKELEKML